MVLDTSALLAILFSEVESDRVVQALAQDDTRLLGAPTLVEASAVMRAKRGDGGVLALDSLIERADIRIVPMTLSAAKLARLGYDRFGKGVGEPGVLNFGDCLTYGIAMAERQPLLFKGDDFSRTDIDVVSY